MRGRGFTAIEVLVSAALFSLVIGGVYLLYTTMQGTLDRGQARTDLQQNARAGLDRLVQDLRMAGYNPGTSAEPLRAAGTGCISFMIDGTQITYDTAEDANDNGMPRRRIVRRREGGAPPQPQAEAVATLAFAYHDVYNQPLAPGIAGSCPPAAGGSTLVLASDQRRQITRVTIMLRTSSRLSDAHPGVGPHAYTPESYTLKTDVRLRNR
jgi:prepilin-type N-terminal cleavage/methylation domain-containing protein